MLHGCKDQPFDINELNLLLAYDPENGTVSWLDSGNKRINGLQAGSLNVHGYRMIKVRGKNLFAHKVAWFLHHGVWPDRPMDHIDQDRANNRIANLRLATHSQNSINKPPRKGSGHGYKGITLERCSGRWVAQIQARPRNFKIGRFATAEAAARAYDQKAQELFGEYAYLNFPTEA